MEKERIDKEAAMMAIDLADSLNLNIGTNIAPLRQLCRRVLVNEYHISVLLRIAHKQTATLEDVRETPAESLVV